MSIIDKIAVGGTTYDIKDAALSSDFEAYVTKGTITHQDTDLEEGVYYINGNGFVAFASNANYYSVKTDISALGGVSVATVLASLAITSGAFIFDVNNVPLNYENGTGSADAVQVALKIPEGAKYIAASIAKAKYTGISDFDVHTMMFDAGLFGAGLYGAAPKDLSAEKAWDIGSFNRLNPAEFEVGKTINKMGVVSASNDWRLSGYIPVKPGMVLYAKGHSAGAYALYNRDKVVVSTSSTPNWANPFTVPADVYYIRITLTSTGYATAYVSTKDRFDAFATLEERARKTLPDLTFIEKVSVIEFTDGYYDTGGSTIDIGSVVDIDTKKQTDTNYECVVVSCVAGEQFTIRVAGAGTARAWAFLDEDRKLLCREINQLDQIIDRVITAPTDTAYLVIHNKKTILPVGEAYRGIYLKKTVDDGLDVLVQPRSYSCVSTDVQDGFYTIDTATSSATYGSVVLNNTSGTAYKSVLTDISDVSAGSAAYVTASFNGGSGAYFCDANMVPIDWVNGSNATTKDYAVNPNGYTTVLKLEVPYGTKYLARSILASYNKTPSDFDIQIASPKKRSRSINLIGTTYGRLYPVPDGIKTGDTITFSTFDGKPIGNTVSSYEGVSQVSIAFYDANKQYIDYVGFPPSLSNRSVTVTLSSTAAYVSIIGGIPRCPIMLVLGNDRYIHEPYYEHPSVGYSIAEKAHQNIAKLDAPYANYAHAVGSYVIVNDQLYKVTAAIAKNGDIVPGTNCTATTVADELAALAARVAALENA